jgi:hypothetical protein
MELSLPEWLRLRPVYAYYRNPRRKKSAAIVIITIGQHLVLLEEFEAVKNYLPTTSAFAWSDEL